MKKISSILLIGLFLLLQANRWTAYMSCQLKNQYSAISCDCEKILSSSGDAPADHQLAHAHWPPDDFFYPVQVADIQASIEIISYDEQPTGRQLPGFPLNGDKPPAV